MSFLKSCDKGHLASRPLSHLPYFHGVMNEAAASTKLCRRGEFLVFLNMDRNKAVTLALRSDNGKVLCLSITGAAEGHFRIKGINGGEPHFNIESLINFHLQNGLFVSRTQVMHFMKRPSLNRSLQLEHTTTSPCDIERLKYYAGKAKDSELSRWLANDGDYLLRSLEDGKVFQLCVFWDECICILKNTLLVAAPRFILPRQAQCEPWESVDSVDHFLKSMVRGGFFLEGVQLKQAVDINELQSDGDDTLRELQGSPVQRSFIAKLPLHKQPYYHGIISTLDIDDRLTCPGQFCVFFERIMKTLFLAVRSETDIFRFSIKADGVGKVWLSSDLKFGTVEELVDYHTAHGLPATVTLLSKLTLSLVRASLQCQRGEVLPKICEAVRNPYHFTDVTVEACDLEKVGYYYGYMSRARAAAKLIDDGDFLLRRDCSGRLLLCVRWLNRCRHLHLNEKRPNGLFRLYGRPHVGPREFVQTIDEFIKSLVRCQQKVRGLILRRPVYANARKIYYL